MDEFSPLKVSQWEDMEPIWNYVASIWIPTFLLILLELWLFYQIHYTFYAFMDVITEKPFTDFTLLSGFVLSVLGIPGIPIIYTMTAPIVNRFLIKRAGIDEKYARVYFMISLFVVSGGSIWVVAIAVMYYLTFI